MFERLVRLEKRDIRRHDGEKEINVVRVLCVAYFFLNERERIWVNG
jgi:hypothetical protein